MIKQPLATAIKYWSYIAPLVKYAKNDKELNTLSRQLDELLDIVGNDENHPLMGLVDTLSHLITVYEAEQAKPPKIKGIAALKFLIEAHHLTQSDLSEIASQGVLSEILHGKRMLNLRQIKLLAKRFHVDPSTFIDD